MQIGQFIDVDFLTLVRELRNVQQGKQHSAWQCRWLAADRANAIVALEPFFCLIFRGEEEDLVAIGGRTQSTDLMMAPFDCRVLMKPADGSGETRRARR